MKSISSPRHEKRSKIEMNTSDAHSLKEWLEFKDFRPSRFTSGKWIPLKLSNSDDESASRVFCSVETLVVFDEAREDCSQLDWHELGFRRDETTAHVDGDHFFAPAEYFDYDCEKVTGILPVTELWHEDGEKIWELNQEIVLSLRLLRRGDVWVRPSENYVEVARLERDSISGQPIELRIKATFLGDYLKARSASLLSTGFCCREHKGDSLVDVDWDEGNRETQEDNQEWQGYRGNDLDNADIHYLFGKLWWKNWFEKGAVSTRIASEPHPDQIKFFTDNQSEEAKSLDEIDKEFLFLYFEPSLISSLLRDPRGHIDWWSFDSGKIGIGQTNFPFGVNELGKIVIYARDITRIAHWFLIKLKSHNIVPEGGIGDAFYQSRVRGFFTSTVAPEKSLFESAEELQSTFESRYGSSLFRSLPSEREFLKSIHRFTSDSQEDICRLAKELNNVFMEGLEGDSIYNQLSAPSQDEFRSKKAQRRNMLAKLIEELGGDGREETRALAAIYTLRQLDAHSGSSGFEDGLELLTAGLSSENLQTAAVCMFKELSAALGNFRNLLC